MKLLVSPKNFLEAQTVIQSNADIVDVKNPSEGSLGGQLPWIIESIKKIVPADKELSAAVCDSINKPGLIAQALYGVYSLEVNYVKIGLYRPKSKQKALRLLKIISKSKEEYGFKGKLVIAGYADWQRIEAINPIIFPDLVEGLNFDVIMIDTYIKDEKNLFDFFTKEELGNFIIKCHDKMFLTALAGRLSRIHIPTLKSINCDIMGVRSAVCENGDRVNGLISKEKINELVKIIN
ncbi:MAG: (5-formylfuran-3-yl)methyl phosphate synthase [Candidatus Odinarchaeia archaeon]